MNEAFRPVIVTLVKGLGISFWQTESFAIPIILVNNSEAEEAAAALALYRSKNRNAHIVSINLFQSAGSALALGLKEAVKLGFTHAVTLTQPFEDEEALKILVDTAKENPASLIEASTEDTRRAFPLREAMQFIEKHGGGSGFEARFAQEFPGNKVTITLPGKPKKLSFTEKTAAFFKSLLG